MIPSALPDTTDRQPDKRILFGHLPFGYSFWLGFEYRLPGFPFHWISDPMFGASLLDEYTLAHSHLGVSLDPLRELAANSVEASFLPPARKLLLLSRIEQYR